MFEELTCHRIFHGQSGDAHCVCVLSTRTQNRYQHQPDSPRPLDSCGSLRASLASLSPVLESPDFAERAAPVDPARQQPHTSPANCASRRSFHSLLRCSSLAVGPRMNARSHAPCGWPGARAERTRGRATRGRAGAALADEGRSVRGATDGSASMPSGERT